jgi:membrane protein DedA with SNARE-associated domain
MESVDAVLTMYGPAALFTIMLLKAAGVPVPLPADLLMLAAAARAADGKLPLWETFGLILVALVLGGLVQFGLARGPARGLLYRYGRLLGLTPTRLDRAAGTVQRGGVLGIAVAILTPGVRSVTVAGCGLAGTPLRVFVPGLVLGSAAFLALHVGLGFGGGLLLNRLATVVPLPGLIGIALAAAGAIGWLVIRHRQAPAAPAATTVADAAGAWCEACCPVCLALGVISQRPHAEATAATPLAG